MREQDWAFMLICSMFGICILADLIVKGLGRMKEPRRGVESDGVQGVDVARQPHPYYNTAHGEVK